jgi:dihydroorotase
VNTRTPNAKALLVSGAHLVDPTQKLNKPMDLLIEKGRVSAIAKPGELKTKAKALKADQVDAKGLHLFPGFVDLDCSVYEPGAEHVESFSTVSRAAASGGFTTILAKPVTTPLNDNAFMTDFILRRAREHSNIRVIPMGALTAAKEGKKLAEIGSMVQAGVRVVGDGAPIMDSYLMRKALEYSRAFNVPVFSFPEDRFLAGQGVMNQGLNSNRLGLRGIPSAAEEIIVARDLVLARHSGATIHFQPLSTKGAVELVRQAKASGVAVTAETHAPYFTLTSDAIATYDANFKCFPPLRSEEDLEAIIDALADGTLDVVSSGHLPQTRSSKEQAFEYASPGMIGLESSFSLLLELVRKKRISISRVVELLSSAPAKILGQQKEIGTLKTGAWADFTCANLNQKFTFDEKRVHGSSTNSPFFGVKMQGTICFTYVAGTEVYSEGK